MKSKKQQHKQKRIRRTRRLLRGGTKFDDLREQMNLTIDARMKKSGDQSIKNRVACALDELWEVLTALEKIDNELYKFTQEKDAISKCKEQFNDDLESILQTLKNGYTKNVNKCSTQKPDIKKICGEQFWKFTVLIDILSSLAMNYQSGKLGVDELPWARH